jgi:hypothetical protein
LRLAGQAGERGATLGILVWNWVGVGCTFSVRPAQHQSLETEKRRAQGGFSDPEHRAAAGTFLAIEEGGADFGFGNSGWFGWLVLLRIWRWSV